MGVPSYTIVHPENVNQQEQLFEELMVSSLRNQIMIASSQAQQQREISSENGLISGHSYQLIKVCEFGHAGELVRLMKLRNPSGTDEWTGDWSENSGRWDAELREEFGFVGGDKHVFYMTFDDYMEQYKRTTIITEHVLNPKAHSRVQYTFKEERGGNTKPAFFRIFFENDLDLTQKILSISV